MSQNTFGNSLSAERALRILGIQTSEPPSRRTERYAYRTDDEPYPCGACGLMLFPWAPTGDQYSGICSECDHLNDEVQRQAIEALNRRLLSIGGPQRALRLGDRQCTCPCKCDENDGEQNDTNYEGDSEADDDIESHLTGPAVAAEQQMARTYGWRTNVIANQDEDNERSIFYESPGHYAMACMHDIGLPQESSLTNSENTVGRIEAELLGKVLEPWELEAVHLSTGRPYSSLSRTFPEARSMQLPTNWQPNEHSQPIPTCPHCSKHYSEEFIEWVQNGHATFCESCGIATKPGSLADDPDFHVFNVDFRRAMNSCYCRCDCPLDVASSAANGVSAFREASLELDAPLPALEQASPNPSWRSESPPPLVDTTPLDHAQPSYGPTQEGPAHAEISNEVAAYRQRLRESYNLPELRFSDNPDFVAASLEEVEMALEDAETAVSFESLDEALSYASVAHFFARQFYGDDSDHPAIRRVQDYLRHLADRQSQRDQQGDEDDEMEDIS